MRENKELNQVVAFIEDAISPEKRRLDKDNNCESIIVLNNSNDYEYMQNKILSNIDASIIEKMNVSMEDGLVDCLHIRNSYGGITKIEIRRI